MNKYDFIIAGAGPSGLTAALIAAKLRYKVLLIEKRLETDFLRPYYIGIPGEIGVKLHSLHVAPLTEEDKFFFKKLGFVEADFQNNLVQLKELPLNIILKLNAIQRYLKNQLDKLDVLSKREKISIRYGSEITQVDVDNKTVCINNNESLSYDYLIEADGAKRPLFHLLPNNIPIIKQTHEKIGHSYHMRLQFQLKYLKTTPFIFGNKPNVFTFKYEHNNKLYIGNIFLCVESMRNNTILCQFTGEVPKAKFMQGSKEQALSDVHQLLIQEIFPILGIDRTEFIIEQKVSKKTPDKNSLLINFFTTTGRTYLKRLDPHFPIIAIGDAANNPDFRASHGVTDGILEAIAIQQITPEKPYNFPQHLVDNAQNELKFITGYSKFMLPFFTLFQGNTGGEKEQTNAPKKR